VQIGKRKLFTLQAKGNASDNATFTDPASFSKAALTVSAVVLSTRGRLRSLRMAWGAGRSSRHRAVS
jgi:hypothetical protein